MMKNIKNVDYLLALHTIEGLGHARLKILIEYFKNPKLAWEADEKELMAAGLPRNIVGILKQTRKTLQPETYTQNIIKSGIKILTIFDDSYPESLKHISDPPLLLYYKGNLLKTDQKAIAIVGSRKISGYGKIVTEKFTKELVAVEFTIVSGLARGVDTVAHQEAIKCNGRTIAVLGSGLNNIYPSENKTLAEKIIAGSGAVISELPPDYSSSPGNFPARNRIISGLSQGVLVTEAAMGSGSLITAKLALEQGREVFAVPGPITSFLSEGPIQLIQNGSKAVFKIEDILDELGYTTEVHTKHINLDNLTQEEQLIYELLQNDSKHIDEISRELNWSVSKTASSLIKMEITGMVKNLGAGTYCRV